MTKHIQSLIFIGGKLEIKTSGHGAADGSGCLTLSPDDMHSEIIEDTGREVLRFDLLSSELEAMRDFLNERIPAGKPHPR